MNLYKYLTVEKADEWLIEENSILLTPPIYLNDLHEFRVRREPADLKERRALFEQFQREAPSRLPFEDYDRWVTSKECMDGEAEAMRRLMSEAIGVVSLASDPVNELMWAHYGLNSGVAIGYRSEAVDEIDGKRFSYLPIGIAIEVNYENGASPMKKDFSDAPHKMTTKRECWSYEDEWRIVQNLRDARPVSRGEKTYYALPAKRERIAHVVFGANAEKIFIERLSTWLQSGDARVQKLLINPVTHELELSNL